MVSAVEPPRGKAGKTEQGVLVSDEWVIVSAWVVLSDLLVGVTFGRKPVFFDTI